MQFRNQPRIIDEKKQLSSFLLGSCQLKAILNLFVAVLLLVTVLIGCATHTKRIANLRQSFHDGDLESARAEAEKLIDKNKRDAALVKLDQSLVSLANAEPEKTEMILRQVRDQFAAHDPLAPIGNVASFMVDDQSRPFQPDDYEQLFVLMYLAIANLVQDGDDAFAYANQITSLQADVERRIQQSRNRLKDQQAEQAHQSQLGHSSSARPSESLASHANEPAPLEFKQIALAPYIGAIVHEETHRDYDSAARYFAQVREFAPTFQHAQSGWERAKNGHHSRQGNGVLYVFVGVGKGPYKIEKAEVPTSQAMLIADRILSATGKQTLPPTVAPIKTSRVVVPANTLQSIQVAIDDHAFGETETITDLGQIAIQQNQAKHDSEMARAIVRRIVKKGAIYAGKDALDTQSHSWVDLLINVGGVLWEAAESADTRSWGLLPEKIQVLRVELPVGRHQLHLTAHGQAAGESFATDVEIRDGKNTYAYACFPTEKLAGKIAVSRPH